MTLKEYKDWLRKNIKYCKSAEKSRKKLNLYYSMHCNTMSDTFQNCLEKAEEIKEVK